MRPLTWFLILILAASTGIWLWAIRVGDPHPAVDQGNDLQSVALTEGTEDTQGGVLSRSHDADKARLSWTATPSKDEIFTGQRNIKGVLEHAQLAYGWSEEETADTMRLWVEACRGVERISTDADLEYLAKLDMKLVPAAQLSAFCDGIAGEMDSDVDEEDEIWRHAKWGGWESPIPYQLALILQDEGEERTKQHIVAWLSDALYRLSEGTVVYLVQSLGAGPPAPQFLEPPIRDSSTNSSLLYFAVAQDVAAVLLCQELGGCHGQDHPMVVRQCGMFSLDQPGPRCYQPTDILDAIYQTQTPLEHMAFWSMFNQVSAMLTAHRRKGS